MPNKESSIEAALKTGEGLNMKNVFKIPINVRFRDIDGMGHVNNAVFFTYLGDWISRQKQDIAGGVDGAQEKLAAAVSQFFHYEFVSLQMKKDDYYASR